MTSPINAGVNQTFSATLLVVMIHLVVNEALAASGPFGTFCHHAVTKRAGMTKRAGSPSNLTRFVTLVTNCAVVTKRAATRIHSENVRILLD